MKYAVVIRMSRWLLAFCLALTTAHAGVIYRVDKPGVESSFLFGTMHSADPRIRRMLDGVVTELDASACLVMEMVPDANSMLTASVGMMYQDGRTLEDVLDTKLYTKVIELGAGRGLNEQVLRRMKPWAVAALLSLPDSGGADVLDSALYKSFLTRGKPVYGLETAADQLAVFDRLSDQMQVAMLRETVSQYQQIPELFEAMIAMYVSGDLEGLKRLNETQQAGSSPELSDWFDEQLIGARNLRMLEKLRNYLDSGKAFIAVGALHLVGKNGLVALLKENGFRVSRIEF